MKRPTLEDRPPIDFKTDGYIEALEKYADYQEQQIKELKEENDELNNQVCSDCGSYYSETSEDFKQALK